MSYTFVRLNPGLIPEMDALLADYKRAYPQSMVVPGSVYLDIWFAGGENVICALDGDGKLRGFVAVSNPISNPNRPHTFWYIARLDPGLASPERLHGVFFDKALDRVSEISRGLSGELRLGFQYHASEHSIIDYILSKGAIYVESDLRIRRDLSQEIPVLPPLEGVEIRYSQMEDEAEQRAYVEVCNEALLKGRSQKILPATMSLADWQRTLKDTVLPKGIVIFACNSGQIIGSIYLCWNEEENRRIGRKVGTVENVFVRDVWRRRGIASRMICEGFDYFKENGLQYARLNVNSANPPGLKLYESLGFVTVYESQMYVLALRN